MNRIALFLSFLFPSMLAAQPVEMQIHPSQVGLFGAGNGDFLRANPATSGGEWSPTASLQGSLFLPSGTTGQTLRHNGTGWEANSVLYNSGTNVGVGTSTPGAKLHVTSSILSDASYISKNSTGSVRRYMNIDSKPYAGVFNGAGIIKLPASKRWSGSFLRIKITGYSYLDDEAGWEVIVNGYNFAGQFWYRYSVEVYGTPPFSLCRLADNGTNNAIILGDTTTQWVYSTINIESVSVTYEEIGWDTGWDISIASSIVGYTTVTVPFYKCLYSRTQFGGDVTGTYNYLQIAENAITTNEIANSSITGFDIAAATITSTNLNTTGVASGTYGSATQAPVITVGTDGRIISASNTTISGTNIATSDLTLTAPRILTIGANSLTMKNATTGTGHKLLILSNYHGSSNTPKLLSFTDETDTERGYVSSNAFGVKWHGEYGNYISSGSGSPVIISPGSQQHTFASDGTLTFSQLTSDPASFGSGAWWYNTVQERFKYYSSGVKSVASVETDIVGDAVSANSSSFTLPAQQFYTVADANPGSFTITFDGTMREGIDYVIECRRNGTNTITFDAGSGYNLAVDTFSSFPDDGAVAMGGGGSGIQAPHKVYYVRRHGSSISVK